MLEVRCVLVGIGLPRAMTATAAPAAAGERNRRSGRVLTLLATLTHLALVATLTLLALSSGSVQGRLRGDRGGGVPGPASTETADVADENCDGSYDQARQAEEVWSYMQTVCTHLREFYHTCLACLSSPRGPQAGLGQAVEPRATSGFVRGPSRRWASSSWTLAGSTRRWPFPPSGLQRSPTQRARLCQRLRRGEDGRLVALSRT